MQGCWEDKTCRDEVARESTESGEEVPGFRG
jgi:hypothetical protein